ncbi:hypothetical protein [Rubellicoccus peritrichatus]|uniref:Uncharacterized protein n=1 Tax=Rubellicoccus peritrichatus TaxID=3080537 RepID=A0AAQ3LAE6_9BACT|nr:hypothetical protein [Puniceicoccus sp. CR14]WOO42569.1 hypothetical protein RZN69_05660 [Puniceicoccus sp. CR14]
MISTIVDSPVSASFDNEGADRIEMLRRMLVDLYEFSSFRIHGDIVMFSRFLQRHEDDLESCLLYHVLVGSTPPESCTFLDLDGEYSIELFIREAWMALSFLPSRKRLRISLSKSQIEEQYQRKCNQTDSLSSSGIYLCR